MFLKKLELQGFKSFADKTSLDFHGQVIAIVGPNGSGKSNVTDALRWLLGEREAKNLRSQRTEDLIFAGTPKHSRAGLAQASLHFDNSSGFFPVDFKEVVVSREAARDGSTKIFLNKSEMRLKDIIDFFAKSRLGARGLTTVTQGESDIFIKASPADRRLMIEEILGLKEFRLKKAEAERRLKNSESNIDQARALIDELKPHLNFLRRQTARYGNRERLGSELKNKEKDFYGSRLWELDEAGKKLEVGGRSVLAEEVARRNELKAAEKNLAEIRNSEPEANGLLGELRLRRTELTREKSFLEKELGKLEALRELGGARAEPDRPRLGEIVAEIKKTALLLLEEKDAARLIIGLKKIVSLAEGRKEEAAPEKEENERALNAKLKELDLEIESIAKREEELSRSLADFNGRFRKAFAVLEEEKSKISLIEERKSKIDLEKERLNFRFKDLEEEIRAAGREVEEFRGSSAEKAAGEETRREIAKLRAEIAAIGEIDDGLMKEAAETENRYRFLTEQTADLDRSINDLKKLIGELEKEIHDKFYFSLKTINEEFDKFIKLLFGGGGGKLVLQKPPALEGKEADGSGESGAGVEIDLSLPKKRIKSLDALSGGERSLVSVAALFSLVAVSPPPFLVLDEIDATLDEKNARRLGEIIRKFAKETQFILVTHNRALMEAADILYGVTMAEDGTSRLLSLKLS